MSGRRGTAVIDEECSGGGLAIVAGVVQRIVPEAVGSRPAHACAISRTTDHGPPRTLAHQPEKPAAASCRSTARSPSRAASHAFASAGAPTRSGIDAEPSPTFSGSGSGSIAGQRSRIAAGNCCYHGVVAELRTGGYLVPHFDIPSPNGYYCIQRVQWPTQ